MSYLDNAIQRITRTIETRINGVSPFRATVTGTSGNLTYIRRLSATVADAEPYAKATGDTFIAGDEVLCIPLNGKPVILGKVRR